MHVHWKKPGEPNQLDHLVAEARAAGWPIFGAGLLASGSQSPTLDAMIILEAGTDDDTLEEFAWGWLPHGSVELAAVPRRGDEEYFDSGGAA